MTTPFKNFKTDLYVLAGSFLYGTANEKSDMDYRGFILEPPECIVGRKVFKAKINQEDDVEWQVWGFQQFFHLCEKFNANVVEILFAPNSHVLEQTRVGLLMRMNRQLFIHKGSIAPILGFALSEYRKATSPNEEEFGGHRKEELEKFRFCTKNGSHAIRLLLQASQLILTRDIVFPLKEADLLLDIKNGNVSREDFIKLWENMLLTIKNQETANPLPEPPTDLLDRLYFDCISERVKIVNTLN
jgi:hypothetical protein